MPKLLTTINFFIFFSTEPLLICSLRVIEGLTFLVEFESEESFQSFFEMYGGQEDIHITDLEDETIKKKITIYKRVKDVPIFSSRNLKSKKGNCL